MVPDVMLPKCEQWAYLFFLAHSLQQVRTRVGGDQLTTTLAAAALLSHLATLFLAMMMVSL